VSTEGQSNPPTPARQKTGIVQPLLRGYGPLAALVIAFALMAAFVPTDAPQKVTVQTQADSGQAPIPGQPSTAPGVVTPPTTSGQSGNGHSGNGPGPTTTNPSVSASTPPPVAHSQGCKGPQVTGDPYSPPCIVFKGTNGGVTSAA